MQKKLFPEAGLHGDALASFSAAAGKYGPSALCFHSCAKTVHLGTTATVRLKSALGHWTYGTPTQDCLRWANDKYKGILAFRANLRNGNEEPVWHGAALAMAFRRTHLNAARLKCIVRTVLLPPSSAV